MEIVELAVANHGTFKDASAELQLRAADPPACAALVAAYRQGRAPEWLVAHLLGCLRAPDGYAVVREILLAAPGFLAESYAGPAMARIAGPAAYDDLRAIMMDPGLSLRTREGAAYGLGVLDLDGIAEALLLGVKAARIRRNCAGHIVGSQPGVTGTLIGWLRGEDETAEGVALDAAFSLSAQLGGITDADLARAVQGALDARRAKLAPRIRTMLEERIAPTLTGGDDRGL